MDLLECSPQEFIANHGNYMEALNDLSNWEKVPLLNAIDLHNLRDLRLVRFYGMIQDMHGPEFYSERFEIINEATQETIIKSGKYIDVVECLPNQSIVNDSPNSVTSERQNYVVVTPPGLNTWVRDFEAKRFNAGPRTLPASLPPKRPLDQEMETNESEGQSHKKLCTGSGTQPASNAISPEYLVNFPIPEQPGKVCLVKVYQDFDNLKLNVLCEFVGFLSVNPELAGAGLDEEMEEVEMKTHNPPPSLVPRIHAVSYKILTHNNPLVKNLGQRQDEVSVLKQRLLVVFKQLLFGDGLAAEYLLYHLISNVYLRQEISAIGKFSLNISNFPIIQTVDYVKELYKFLELLLTKSHYFPMTLENMNETTFMPKKDYSANRLTSSVLQLSQNTHFVLDETKLSNGKLLENGINGIKTLTNVINHQKLTCDFTYYQLEFDCDIPILVISEGKSLLPSDVHVVLEVDEMHRKTCEEILLATRHYLTPELLNSLRAYLTLTRFTEYQLSENLQELIQNEFVEMRRTGGTTGDDLHSLLVLARLVCISEGRKCLDEESWRWARKLEEARKTRLKPMKT